MSPRGAHALLALALALSSCAAPPRVAAPAPADLRIVERAVDGDTLLLQGGERVRVLGIDTLELTSADAHVHELALAAQAETARLVEGKRVRIVVGMPSTPRDRYDRLLAYVEIPDAQLADLGLRLVEDGLARPYPSAHPRAESYREAAFRARRERRGEWTDDVQAALGHAPARITVAQAGDHRDALVVVRGRIEPGLRRPRVQPLTLRDSTGALDLVIFSSRFDEIPTDLVSEWSRGETEVTGTIGEHRGRLQIVLEDPFQVEPMTRNLAAPSGE